MAPMTNIASAPVSHVPFMMIQFLFMETNLYFSYPSCDMPLQLCIFHIHMFLRILQNTKATNASIIDLNIRMPKPN